ncbi:MAG: S-layer homology domain-containing protein, partial [Clostridia bacterium]|nr:S-layer homology domain-containing protein [Clostridia bacterium]
MKKRILSTILAAVMLLGMIIMPATAAEGKMPFTDVKQGKWFYDAVEYVWKNDLMNGMTDTTFEPNTAMNRGMLVTVLWRVEGSPAPKGTT